MMSLDTLDVVVIGAGFSGLHVLYNLRNAGFTIKCLERGSTLGGTWHCNRYPGARVDSDGYYYQYTHPSLRSWEYTERFPGRDELTKYFAFVDKEWDLSKDIVYNTEVIGAQFDEATNTWEVTSRCNGKEQITKCRWLIAAVGFSAKPYTPSFKDLDSFKGLTYHTSDWPEEDVDLKNKRVAVIGTGASGVQVIQEIGPHVSHLTVYQRTPNLALPMGQEAWSTYKVKQGLDKAGIDSAFKSLRTTFAGVHHSFYPKNTLDDTPEEQRTVFERLYSFGGFQFWFCCYQDMWFDQEANDRAYAFWAEKTRARITDPVKKDLLAPLVPPHPYGTKRPSLETNFYEICDQPNVDIVDVSAHPILEITEKGVRTSLGEVEVDALVLATGFDSVSGPLTRMAIKGTDGISLKERWANGLETYLGMSIAHYPNLLFTYGPQAPTAFCNGTTSAEFQGEWITQLLQDLREAGVKRFECTEEAQKQWTGIIAEIWANSLFPKAKSWYQGSNIPGKVIQPLNWPGGVPAYLSHIKECRENGYKGFMKS